MNLYPLKFKPIYKQKIWGGDKLKQVFGRQLPDNNIGESWEVAAHPNGTSHIINGIYQGESLISLIEKSPIEILGNKTSCNKQKRFPLLIKILDANDKLSVQVHPDDNYAQKFEGEPGKTEMWYIIQAEPGAKLVYGLKPDTTRNDFSNAVNNGKLASCLNEVEVVAGDIIYMPSGTIHAIEEGILLAEIQQNSDTTYRVYDWDRVGNDGKRRPLHIKQALDVIKFGKKNIKAKSKPLTVKTENYNRNFLVACPYFVTEKIQVINKFKIKPANNKFYTLMNISGQGKISYKDKLYNITPGDTFFLPAALDTTVIEGQLEFLLSYLPGNKKEFVNELKQVGFNDNHINNLAGLSDWEL